MASKPLRILLVEDNPADAELLREALAEMEVSPRWRVWVRPPGVTQVEDVGDALEVLGAGEFEALLLDLSVCQGRLEPFLRLRTSVPDMPIVVLAAGEEEALAANALREGADDCLLKIELDCAPLARSLRYAIERRRLCSRLNEAAGVDALTGLHNQGGFLALAERDRRLAGRLRRGFNLCLIEVEDAGGEDLILDTAEVLRAACGETELAARWSAWRFVAAGVDLRGAGADPLAGRIQSSLRRHNQRRGHRRPVRLRLGAVCAAADDATSIDDLLARAETRLCENEASSLATAAP